MTTRLDPHHPASPLAAGLVAINGTISSLADAALSPLDRGYLFGDSVFEVMVALQGVILRPQAHLARLRFSAEQLGFAIPWSDELMMFELDHLVGSLKTPKTYIRLTVSRGGGLGLRPPLPEVEPTRVVLVTPAPPGIAPGHGLRVQTRHSGQTQRGPHAKTGNYLPSVLALRAAQADGYDDVLWVNADDEITEASSANIILIGRSGDDLEIVTPAVFSGLLSGTTRQTLLTILKEAKIPYQERVVNSYELPRFDEALLCSTIRGLVPIAAIDSHKLHTLRTNAFYHGLQRLYQAWVTVQVGAAVDWSTGRRIT